MLRPTLKIGLRIGALATTLIGLLVLITPLLSPAYQQITYYSGEFGNFEIYLMDVPRQLAANLTRNPGEDSRPAWSPDGQWIAYYAHRQGRTDLHIMRADGRELRRLTESGVADSPPAWSPDGQWIAFAIDHQPDVGLYLIRPDGSDLRQLTAFRTNFITWSPNGKHILLTGNCNNNCDLYVLDTVCILLARDCSTYVRQLTRNGTVDFYPVWSPDSQHFAFMSTRNRSYDLYVMDITCDEKPLGGCEAQQMTFGRAFDGLPAWSPDGRWIAFNSDRERDSEIYVMDSDCDEQNCPARRLTHRDGLDSFPLWSPDGLQIAFTANFDVYVMDATGSNLHQLVHNDLRDQFLTWRP